MAPITLIVHLPNTEDGQQALAKRVAEVHAAAVVQQIKALDCPSHQQLALLDSVIVASQQQDTG